MCSMADGTCARERERTAHASWLVRSASYACTLRAVSGPMDSAPLSMCVHAGGQRRAAAGASACPRSYLQAMAPFPRRSAPTGMLAGKGRPAVLWQRAVLSNMHAAMSLRASDLEKRRAACGAARRPASSPRTAWPLQRRRVGMRVHSYHPVHTASSDSIWRADFKGQTPSANRHKGRVGDSENSHRQSNAS